MVIMINQFHMAFFATALAITVFVLIFTLIQKRTDKPQNRWFLIVLFIILINSISELTTSVFETDYAKSITSYWGLIVSQNIYFLFHSALCPMLYDYVSCVTGKSRRRSLFKSFLLHIPFICTEILVLLNPFYNCVFYYDFLFKFHRNWGEYIIYWVAVFYFALSVFELLFSWKAITPRRSVALSYLFLLTMAGVVIQLLYIDLKTELFSEALALMGAMLAIENEDDRMHVDTGIYNRIALHNDVHNMLIMNEKAGLIFIKISNANIIERVTRSNNYDALAIAVTDFLKTLVPRYKIYSPSKECFVIICDSNELDKADGYLSKIVERFNNLWDIYDNSFKLNASVFKAVIPEQIHSHEEIAYIADSIIPQSVISEHGEIEWITRRSEIERAIKNSINNQKFEVFYQPTFCGDGKVLHGAEALVRMHDENVGDISPEEFIPIAEQIGFVDQIDDFVLHQVCQLIQTGVLEKNNLDCINVNLSVVQCLRPGFFNHIIAIVDQYKVKHSSINFEITESVGAENYSVLSKVAHQLKGAGFSLSMDDYGTGYSNVEGIFSLDFDIVKIDKSILWNAMRAERGRVILENSINMVHGLGCKVLVEGVETDNQIHELQKYGVDYFQGYYFSEPLSKKEFLEYIKVN
ncbi:MAG: EAL domain-containing protein [Pseudobutyrivibrio sp.]|nr:EAL domain-containing protein [Pseudobutyrivibrio sp.]